MEEDDLAELRKLEAARRKVADETDWHIRKASLALLALGADWVSDAACATSDLGPDAWFPENSGDRKTTAKAKHVCWFECPVRLECLEASCLRRENFGVYGGFGRTEREVHAWDYDAMKQVGIV
ncbi:WhiB family transcriptional regulator [Streptomyces sp. NBC_01239]|uniref:WhiB family transcriptional regulator n=1 Tax=Streptomyces sp. NBC_01239 TaxID=2903792 RepID=UPI002251D2F5|nr:WhiB family transcriptional regulator [Streptomyces sp. NBC_01239]MCX4813676.1 WhiB family transcriptional regulator [Streptomyces sp. NBC_01239]